MHEQGAPARGPLRLGVLLFEGFEVLDAFGPVEALASRPAAPAVREVFYIGWGAGAGLQVASSQGSVHVCSVGVAAPESGAEASEWEARQFDALLVPGGAGTRSLVKDEGFLAWLRRTVQRRPGLLVLSVCTGSALLAAAGLLEGRRATSNKMAFDWVASHGQQVQWVREARWVVDGRFWTSAGVSAGTDMALALVAHLAGEATAETVARYMEWTGDWRDPDVDPWGAVARDPASEGGGLPSTAPRTSGRAPGGPV